MKDPLITFAIGLALGGLITRIKFWRMLEKEAKKLEKTSTTTSKGEQPNSEVKQ